MSRIKGLPPKVQNILLDSRGGVRTTKFRVGTLDHTLQPYNDSSTINFDNCNHGPIRLDIDNIDYKYKQSSYLFSYFRFEYGLWDGYYWYTTSDVSSHKAYMMTDGSSIAVFNANVAVSSSDNQHSLAFLDTEKQYLDIDNLDDAFSLTDGAHDNPFMISGWLDILVLPFPIIGKVGAATAEYIVYVDSSGYLTLQVFDDTNSATIQFKANTVMPVHEWAHFIIIYTGPSSAKMYINGTIISSTRIAVGTYDTMCITTANTTRIGKIPTFYGYPSTIYACGLIDEFGFYKYPYGSSDLAIDLDRAWMSSRSTNTKKINYPLHVSEDSQSLVDYVDFSTDLSTTGRVMAGISDVQPILDKTMLSTIQPYVEEAKDFNSFTTHESNFYFSGSSLNDVGDGFQIPTLSKTKIEFDLSPVSASSFGIGYNNAKLMGYFNKTTRLWDGLGPSANWKTYSTNAQLLNVMPVGFAPSLGLDNTGSANGFVSNSAHPINTFGFPFEQRYNPTSEQLFPLSGVLPNPFLLEKIEFDFSASFGLGMTPASPTNAGYSAVNTFFVLNQRTRPNRINIVHTVVSSSTSDEEIVGSNTGHSFNDLVTYAHLASINADAPTSNSMLDKDLVVTSNVHGNSGLEWSGSFSLTAPVRMGRKHDGVMPMQLGSTQPYALTQNYNGTRSGYYQISGKDFGTPANDLTQTSSSIGKVIFSNNLSKETPYILYPTDNLVFGWQLPHSISNRLVTPVPGQSASAITFFPDVGKVTLYGSFLKENKEYHDNSDQNLSTEQIYEPIGDIPLDQFQNETGEMYYHNYNNRLIRKVNTFNGNLIGFINDYNKPSDYNIKYTNDTNTNIPRLQLVDIEVATPGMTFNEGIALIHASRFRGIFNISEFVCEEERYDDTALPDYRDITQLNSGNIVHTDEVPAAWYAQPVAKVVLGVTRTESCGPAQISDNIWAYDSPFNERYKNLIRQATYGYVSGTAFSEGVLSPSPDPFAYVPTNMAIAHIPTVEFLLDSLITPYKKNVTFMDFNLTAIWPFAGSIIAPTKNYFWKAYYGLVKSEKDFEYTVQSGSSECYQCGSLQIRGWKYGIRNAFPQYTKCVFNRSHFGQPRDMLEQRQYSIFIDASAANTVTDSPVRIKMVSGSSVPSGTYYRYDIGSVGTPYVDGSAI